LNQRAALLARAVQQCSPGRSFRKSESVPVPANGSINRAMSSGKYLRMTIGGGDGGEQNEM
jgi:hypothetical protein